MQKVIDYLTGFFSPVIVINVVPEQFFDVVLLLDAVRLLMISVVSGIAVGLTLSYVKSRWKNRFK